MSSNTQFSNVDISILLQTFQNLNKNLEIIIYNLKEHICFFIKCSYTYNIFNLKLPKGYFLEYDNNNYYITKYSDNILNRKNLFKIQMFILNK